MEISPSWISRFSFQHHSFLRNYPFINCPNWRNLALPDEVLKESSFPSVVQPASNLRWRFQKTLYSNRCPCKSSRHWHALPVLCAHPIDHLLDGSNHSMEKACRGLHHTFSHQWLAGCSLKWRAIEILELGDWFRNGNRTPQTWNCWMQSYDDVTSINVDAIERRDFTAGVSGKVSKMFEPCSQHTQRF